MIFWLKGRPVITPASMNWKVYACAHLNEQLGMAAGPEHVKQMTCLPIQAAKKVPTGIIGSIEVTTGWRVRNGVLAVDPYQSRTNACSCQMHGGLSIWLCNQVKLTRSKLDTLPETNAHSSQQQVVNRSAGASALQLPGTGLYLFCWCC